MTEAFIPLLFYGSFGLFLHWLKRYGRKQTERNFSQYMLTHQANSVGSVASMVAAVFLLSLSADVELSKEIIANAFLAGFVIDSVANK